MPIEALLAREMREPLEGLGNTWNTKIQTKTRKNFPLPEDWPKSLLGSLATPVRPLTHTRPLPHAFRFSPRALLP